MSADLRNVMSSRNQVKNSKIATSMSNIPRDRTIAKRQSVNGLHEYLHGLNHWGTSPGDCAESARFAAKIARIATVRPLKTHHSRAMTEKGEEISPNDP